MGMFVLSVISACKNRKLLFLAPSVKPTLIVSVASRNGMYSHSPCPLSEFAKSLEMYHGFFFGCIQVPSHEGTRRQGILPILPPKLQL